MTNPSPNPNPNPNPNPHPHPNPHPTPTPTPTPNQTSKRLAKLAHITDIEESGGETAVLLRGLVVCLVGLIYGGGLVSMLAAHVTAP